MSKSEAKSNCGMCQVSAIIRGGSITYYTEKNYILLFNKYDFLKAYLVFFVSIGFVEEVQRTCLADLTGSNEWKEHIPACSDQPLAEATNRFCYCDTDYCNELPSDLPLACDVAIPTIPPKKSYNCFQCSWSDSPDSSHDNRCGWGNNFDVPQNQNDPSVGRDCLKCGLQLVYKGSKCNNREIPLLLT